MVPSTKSVAWKYLPSQSMQYGTHQCKHCIMIPDHHMHCIMTPFLNTCIAWRYHTSHVVHDDSFHCMQCMMKSSNPCIVLRNHTTPALHINTYSSWWYLSTHALHDDTWSSHTLHDDTNTSSVRALHDDTEHHINNVMIPDHPIYRMMIPFIKCIVWWYHFIRRSA
jgi:hypothetical protein